MTVITDAEPQHVEALVDLTEEMDRFYGATTVEPRTARLAQVRDALFGKAPAAHALLAWDDGERALGFASYSFLWPAVGVTRSLYLKELYVADTARRGGVGRQLMDRLFRIADAQRCSRVEWTTERDNTDAVRFYESLGANSLEAKVFFRTET